MRLILVPDATAAIIAYDQRIFPVRSAVCVETHKRLYIGMELLQLTRSECCLLYTSDAADDVYQV